MDGALISNQRVFADHTFRLSEVHGLTLSLDAFRCS